jgi:MATE family multidrug resistance protein
MQGKNEQSSDMNRVELPEKGPEGGLREVVYVAWPIVVSMLSYTAMGVFDTMFVGMLGATELAAVGIATTAIFLINSLFMGTLQGVKVVCAQTTGAGHSDTAVTAGWIGAALAVPFGLCVIGLSYLDGPIFAALGGPDPVQSMGRDYFGVRALGAAFWYVTIALGNFFQGTGDTRTPMVVNLFANGVNVVLDPALIFGWWALPALGVTGAAWATVFAQGGGMLLVLVLFVRQVGWSPRVEWSVGRSILRLGVPMGLNQALGVAGFAGFTAMLARMGEAELAAHQVAIKIISVSFLPGYGISQATSILTGQYVGSGSPASARRAFRTAVLLGVGLMGLCGIVFFVWPVGLLRIFTQDPDVIAVGARLLWVAALFQVFDAVAMVATGGLNGTGDTAFTMWTNVVSKWVVLLPCAYLFGFVFPWGAAGAWMGLTVEVLFVAVVVLWRFSGSRWEDKAVA